MVEHVPDANLKRLDEHSIGLADRFGLHQTFQHYIDGVTQVARQAAAAGNVIFVGRGMAQIFWDVPESLHLRLVAPLDWRARRISKLDSSTLDVARTRCQEVDRARERFARFFFGTSARQVEQYDMTVNTTRLSLDDVVSIVVALTRHAWTISEDV